MDLPNVQKEGKIIGFEPGVHLMIGEATGKDRWNMNVICDKDMMTVPPSRHYLFKVIFYIFVAFLIKYMVGY